MQAIIKNQDLLSYRDNVGDATMLEQKQGKQPTNYRTQSGISGYEVYTDAAWKISADSLSTTIAKVGIGIFIQPAGEHKKEEFTYQQQVHKSTLPSKQKPLHSRLLHRLPQL